MWSDQSPAAKPESQTRKERRGGLERTHTSGREKCMSGKDTVIQGDVWGREGATVIDYVSYLLNDKLARTRPRGTHNLLSLVLEQEIVCLYWGGKKNTAILITLLLCANY